MNTIQTGKVTALFPTRADIEAITVGGEAPNCFGRMAKVAGISARQEDIHGKLFICYTTEFGPGSTISNSLKEDEILRDAGLTCRHTSAELYHIENAHRAARAAAAV